MERYLGIELGSTRIKAVAINEEHQPVASGDYGWVSRYENGIWTYDLEEALRGVIAALSGIADRQNIRAVGISGMMHGYLAFDKEWNLLVPFRTWQNTITAEAASELTELFGFNIPQRWSIAHLYQAVLNGEEHVSRVAHITTLAGYVHYMLTGVNVVGVGEASGIFPVDSESNDYDEAMVSKLEGLLAKKNVTWRLRDVLPKVMTAGEVAGTLTEQGANKINHLLPVGIPFAPPEGDAGTGMVATNAVAPRTGNISAGTSIFSMVVLEKSLQHVYEEIDMVTTPAGRPVAMVHCNNCTNDSNAWIKVLSETLDLFEVQYSINDLYTKLYEEALKGDADCGGVLVCNYMAGEGITHMDEGRPLVTRRPESQFNLANFMRATLYATMATLTLGMSILEQEDVAIDNFTGHGGLFKTPGVGQRFMAAACNTPITCMKTAGEGGPYGMALLAAYMMNKEKGECLEAYLSSRVFGQVDSTTIEPNANDKEGYQSFMKQYEQLLCVEETAIKKI